MAASPNDMVRTDGLIAAVVGIFVAAGVPVDDATIVASDLVGADVEGVGSHGVMLVPMYIERLLAGSVSKIFRSRVISDRGGAVVVDARDSLGQLTARQAVSLAAERAKKYGLAAITVRNGFHIGAAGRYARLLADEGCIGIVMANTRPLMPAPGAAEALTGNNPIAIAAPSNGQYAPEVDMALSAVAMGKIRNAAAAGQAIPEGWATDKSGNATTDANAAIAGMLLPAAGPKGYGLAFLIDLICGGLSDGAIGAEVAPLYGDPARPYRCSSAFLAIDVSHFVAADEFKRRANAETDRVSAAQRAAGVDRVYAPGELAYAARSMSNGSCRVSPKTLASIVEVGRKLGLDITSHLSN